MGLVLSGFLRVSGGRLVRYLARLRLLAFVRCFFRQVRHRHDVCEQGMVWRHGRREKVRLKSCVG